jgi:Ala-tRNA(Pro) deacylase
MIPSSILQYLNRALVPFVRRWHPRAVSGQQLAASLHITGHRVSKCVVVDADGERTIAVLPVTEEVDPELLAQGMGCRHVRPLAEGQLVLLFPDCELGAEPPLGRLYQLPVVVDTLYAQGEEIIFRAGSHEETVEMPFLAYDALEHPRLVRFARRLRARPAVSTEARA